MTEFARLAMQNALAQSAMPAAQVQKAVKKIKKPAAKGTIAESIIAGLKAGRKPQDVLAAVLKKHKSQTTIACVYWYASRIKRGLIK